MKTIKYILKVLFCKHTYEWAYEMTWTYPDKEKVCLGCHCTKCGWQKEITFFRDRGCN